MQARTGLTPAGRPPASTSQQSRRLAALRAILAVSIISTGLHFAHNFVEVHHYPESDLATYTTTRWLIPIVWPTLTAVGLLGYRLYARGMSGMAYLSLAAYSLLGLVTLAHFIDGSPDIPPWWYATIFTDAIAGAALLAFVVWSGIMMPAPRRAVRP